MSAEGTFSTTLQTQLYNPPAAALKTELVNRKLPAEETSLPELATRWNAVAVEHGKTLVVLLIPIYAVVLATALVHRRRPIVQHLVFATHLVAFVLVLLMVNALAWKLVWPLSRAAGLHLGWFGTDAGSSSILGVVLAACLVPGLRRGYDLGPVAAFLLAPFLVIGLALALQLYRFALFFTVYIAT